MENSLDIVNSLEGELPLSLAYICMQVGWALSYLGLLVNNNKIMVHLPVDQLMHLTGLHLDWVAFSIFKLCSVGGGLFLTLLMH